MSADAPAMNKAESAKIARLQTVLRDAAKIEAGNIPDLEWPDEPGIYFVVQNDRCKIGKAKSIKHRLTGGATFSGYNLRLVAFEQADPSLLIELESETCTELEGEVIRFEPIAEGARIDRALFIQERKLHERFAHLHVKGEWFFFKDDLVAHVRCLRPDLRTMQLLKVLNNDSRQSFLVWFSKLSDREKAMAGAVLGFSDLRLEP